MLVYFAILQRDVTQIDSKSLQNNIKKAILINPNSQCKLVIY